MTNDYSRVFSTHQHVCVYVRVRVRVIQVIQRVHNMYSIQIQYTYTCTLVRTTYRYVRTYYVRVHHMYQYQLPSSGLLVVGNFVMYDAYRYMLHTCYMLLYNRPANLSIPHSNTMFSDAASSSCITDIPRCKSACRSRSSFNRDLS